MSWSVVIPYYNEAAFLPRTLRSLLAQDLRPFCLILVDNGSTDGSEDLCRRLLAHADRIAVTYLREPRPGKIHALETGLNQVVTEFVAFCDADTYYPPHYLGLADRLFSVGAPSLIAVMASDVYAEPEAWPARLRRLWLVGLSRVLSWQAHTGGFGQCFRVAALKEVGGYAFARWPYVLEDHEIMQRVFDVGTARHHYDLWCMPSDRRVDRDAVRWTLWERLVYHGCPRGLQGRYFRQFLGPRLARRALDNVKLRERVWRPSKP